MKNFWILIVAAMAASCSTKALPQLEITPLKSGVDVTLRAISAVNDSVVWVSGARGHVLKSIDSGETWQVFRVDTSGRMDFRSLHAWNADSALVFAIDNPAVAYKTSDGGVTWREVFRREQPGIFVNSLSFCDARNGIAVGDPLNGKFLLLQTQDGGESWQDASAPDSKKGDGGFAASNTCIQYLPSGKIVFITGMGSSDFYSRQIPDTTWQTAPTGIVAGGSSGADGIYTVYMSDDRNGIAAGGNYKEVEKNTNVVAYTTDGGQTWQISPTPPHGFISCVKPVPHHPGLFMALGSHGYSVSYDSGQNWVPAGTDGYHTLDFAKGGCYLYAAGEKGKLARIKVR